MLRIVKVRWEKYVVRCNTGYLYDGREVATVDAATKFPTEKAAEHAIGRHRKRGWNALWVEQLPKPWKKAVTS